MNAACLEGLLGASERVCNADRRRCGAHSARLLQTYTRSYTQTTTVKTEDETASLVSNSSAARAPGSGLVGDWDSVSLAGEGDAGRGGQAPTQTSESAIAAMPVVSMAEVAMLRARVVALEAQLVAATSAGSSLLPQASSDSLGRLAAGRRSGCGSARGSWRAWDAAHLVEQKEVPEGETVAEQVQRLQLEVRDCVHICWRDCVGICLHEYMHMDACARTGKRVQGEAAGSQGQCDVGTGRHER